MILENLCADWFLLGDDLRDNHLSVFFFLFKMAASHFVEVADKKLISLKEMHIFQIITYVLGLSTTFPKFLKKLPKSSSKKVKI